ncbi:hypothetical protein Tco_0310087 [Tanacetum coccineum]
MVNNLCTIWVGQFKLHANKARFQRATLNKGQRTDHKKVANSSRPNSEDFGKIIFRGKVYWSRAKEVPGWTPDLVEDSDEEELSDDDSLEEGMKNLESENYCSNSFEVPDTVFENEGGSKKDSSVDPFWV